MSLGASYIFDKTYTIDNASVTQFAAVVQGASDGSCALPGAQNATHFLGFTQAKQANQNAGVAVRRLGISAAIGHGAIARGDRVAIYSAAGDVYSVEATVAAGAGTASVTNVIGRAENTTANNGDVVYVWIEPAEISLAAS
jgi:hypothetical protein